MIHDSDIYESSKNGKKFSIREHWYGKNEYYILVYQDEDEEVEVKISKIELEKMIEEKRLIKK
jgi:predicted membrane protein